MRVSLPVLERENIDPKTVHKLQNQIWYDPLLDPEFKQRLNYYPEIIDSEDMRIISQVMFSMYRTIAERKEMIAQYLSKPVWWFNPADYVDAGD